jgi:hypothetical protein
LQLELPNPVASNLFEDIEDSHEAVAADGANIATDNIIVHVTGILDSTGNEQTAVLKKPEQARNCTDQSVSRDAGGMVSQPAALEAASLNLTLSGSEPSISRLPVEQCVQKPLQKKPLQKRKPSQLTPRSSTFLTPRETPRETPQETPKLVASDTLTITAPGSVHTMTEPTMKHEQSSVTLAKGKASDVTRNKENAPVYYQKRKPNAVRKTQAPLDLAALDWCQKVTHLFCLKFSLTFQQALDAGLFPSSF